MNKFIKYAYITAGWLSLVLGIVGIFLPVLPTVPFLLVTAYCFAKGSKRFHDWFVVTKLYKKYLERFVKERCIPLKTKILILVYSTLAVSASFVLAPYLWAKIFLICVLTIQYFYFIFVIKTKPSVSSVC